jgi:indole-3-glycerol phosphate synthase / phosphoribosylanthranilate isomerase
MALTAILERKRADVAERKRARPGFGTLAPSDRSLEQALRRGRPAFVLEHKRASPSKGVLRADSQPADVGRAYAPFADAVSVLCDAPFFGGSHEHLAAIRDVVPCPVLCKDFVVDAWQIDEARAFGADAILLMCSVLGQDALSGCLEAARARGMDALVEVHDEAELERALAAGARIVGINNRDLRTLAVDLAVTERLAPRVPHDVVCVAESGIADHHDVLRLAPSVDAFLVGSSLMAATDLDEAVRALVFGRVKICGLTRQEHAEAAWQAGATHGGLVLWARSPRGVGVDKARAIRRAAPLRWVAVFVDESPDTVADAARELALDAVQLHGRESPAYVAALRPALPPGCAIWKARRVGADEVGDVARSGADRLLLDTYREELAGGTGQTFDWGVVGRHPERAELVLSGGIGPNNAAAAQALGTWAIDLSSGVEREPGVKDPARIDALFAAVRGAPPDRPPDRHRSSS